MPTRIVREGINSSERVNQLTERAELFYRKLMSVVDDYGRYFTNPISLLGSCYPMRPSVTIEEVGGFLNECVNANLIVIYGRGKYLQLLDFRQQTRTKSKFPEPTENELLIKCKADVKQMYRVVVGEGGVEGGDVGVNVFEKIKGRIETMYGRKNGQAMSYVEESSLAEISRRPSALAELAELEAFKAKPDSYFPQSVYKLVTGWDEVLDRSRANGAQQSKPRRVGWIQDANYDIRTPEEKAEQERKFPHLLKKK